MSGVEAAGIALAVVPLIVSAIKSYKIAFHPIVVLCRYRKEFRDFKARLTVQKQLFENHCHVLLSKVHAEENLKDFASEGPRRTLESSTQVEQETEAKLALYLGNQYDACVSLISLIEDALLALQKHDLKDVYSEGFDEAHIQNLSLLGKAGRREIRARLKFSFSKQQLLDHVAGLGKLNDSFASLIKSIEKLQKIEQGGLATSLKSTAPGHEFQLAQEAASRLYEELACVSSCLNHVEHNANICLATNVDLQLNGGFNTQQCSRICFEMAFEFIQSDDGCRRTPICVKVESSSVSRIVGANTVKAKWPRDEQECFTPKRSLDAVSVADTNGRRVRFVLDNQAKETDTMTMTSVLASPTALLHTIPDLRPGQNFCLHLEQLCHSKAQNTIECIGVLQQTKPFRHMLYRPPTSDCHEMISLEAALAMVSENRPFGGFSSLDRVRLARSLATVVLQFHTTPWLPEQWRSRDICFYTDRNSTLRSPSLKSPHLSAKLSRPHSRSQPHLDVSDKQPCHAISLSPIRNSILFGLGMMFIELSLETPFKKLQSLEDKQAGPEIADVMTANRLDGEIARPLGQKYARITRKCLNCDFGVAKYDLREPELQNAFHEDVIQGLSGLEAALKRLDLD